MWTDIKEYHDIIVIIIWNNKIVDILLKCLSIRDVDKSVLRLKLHDILDLIYNSPDKMLIIIKVGVDILNTILAIFVHI